MGTIGQSLARVFIERGQLDGAGVRRRLSSTRARKVQHQATVVVAWSQIRPRPAAARSGRSKLVAKAMV
jgi:hypothetical protein